ncbi:hypothetical protein Ahy_A09g042970 isoform C [Arachis hypogaea]|uniref:Uncharacterized protein n=1 Tax=Arachis hypogaea TaxID=3818 RepID=A0A444XQZ4_ARAHY|nr:hypothetical protein Ahy_B09g098291 isoform C [Arachis hypogaea]RYR38025.1 hypothetical protein Ahy_A09g042970 isoform C [Arachis hypogaea]
MGPMPFSLSMTLVPMGTEAVHPSVTVGSTLCLKRW